MAKRFTETTIWEEDWFTSLPIKYILLWQYIKDKCDHAGIWKPNKRLIEFIVKEEIDLQDAFRHFNADKPDNPRITILNNGNWLLNGFCVFQYGKTLNMNNKVHKSVFDAYQKNGIDLSSLWGQLEVKQGVKDKDKDKDISLRKESFIEGVNQFTNYSQEMRDAFISYWTESDGKVLRFETQDIFEISRRLATWNRISSEKKQIQQPKQQTPQPEPEILRKIREAQNANK